MALTRNNNLSVLDARFRNIALSSKGNIPIISDKFCLQKTTTRAYEKFDYWAGVGEAIIVPENSVYPTKDIKKGDDATLTPDKWGFVFNVTKEMVDDNEFEPIVEVLGKAGRTAMRQTKERQGVNLLNNGFSTSYPTPDGAIALFSLSHILKQTGATQANLTTAAALDLDSLWGGINLMKTTVDDSGTFASIYQPQNLIVPQQLERRAHELLKSDWAPQTTENQNNVVKGLYTMNILTSPFLTSTTAWFLTANPSDVMYYGLIQLDREAFSVKPLFDVKGADLGSSVDRDVYSWRFKERYTFGLTHWNGTFGNAGA